MKHSRLTKIVGILILAIIFTSFTWLTNEPNTDKENLSQEIDPVAVELLQKSMDFLSNSKNFSVRAQSTLEDVLITGNRIDFEIASNVTVSRPNMLFAERNVEDYTQKLFYDGKTVTLFNPADNVYATEKAPEGLEDMLHAIRDDFGLIAPIADLIYEDAFLLLMYEVNLAAVIGTEIIDNVKCTHLLFSRPGVDFQIWIAEKGSPLPYKFVVTDTTTDELLAFTTYFKDWNMDPEISKGIFKFKAPKEAFKIEFLTAETSDKK